MRMDPEDWAKIVHAYDVIAQSNGVNKIESDKFIIYKVGSNLIRIDIKVR